MNNLKKIGLTALAGSLASISAHAAEMTVSGASVLTWTQRDTTESTGNNWGMKTNLGFNASGEVNGYTVSYMQTSQDQFAGMSSARLSMDMGDLGIIAFDQGSGSGLATIDDKTPTAAEEIWDGIDNAAGTSHGGLVGAAGNTGVFNYIKEVAGIKVNAAARTGSGTASSDGGTSGAGNSAWDFALTTDGAMMGVDGLELGAGYGEAEIGQQTATTVRDNNIHMTAFTNYSYGPVTAGVQMSYINNGSIAGVDEELTAWGLAFNVNENLSVSYGERTVDYLNLGGALDVEEKGEGIAVAYTMGSMKIAGNRNESSNNDNVTGANDMNTEIAVSFAF